LAPEPKYSFTGYLAAIYAAYLPTQSMIAIGETILTGAALHSIGKQKPEVLEDLGVEKKGSSRAKRLVVKLLVLGLLASSLRAELVKPAAAPAQAPVTATASPAGFPGMDEAVNERIAAEAGAHARDPYLNTEKLGDLWNFLLLFAGAVSGFVIGRNWDRLFTAKRPVPKKGAA